ncbi:MAG: S9 family peptidase, partial [Proteiniphilum sp.]|nr:S9 family peptidase [Proteiniphilum sp.]
MHRTIALTIAGFLLAFSLFSQKKPLDHSVYDNWKSLAGTTISDDGTIMATLIAPQEGDTTLMIRDLTNNRSLTVERVKRFSLSSDGKWIVGVIKAPLMERRQARIDKKKGDELPKDTLLIIHHPTFAMEKIAGVKSFKTANESFTHMAYSITLPADTAKKEKKKEKPEELLILRNLLSQREDTIRNAKEHLFSKYGNAFAVVIQPEKKDSTDIPGVHFFDLDKQAQKRISGEKREYKSPAFDEPGTQLVYLSTADTSKVEQKRFDVRYYPTGADSASVIADGSATGLPVGWIFNEHASPSFSKDGSRILIGAAPRQEPKDTTLVDFEMASLDIWHWRDPQVQPQQLAELNREKRRTYRGIISPSLSGRFLPVATEEMPHATIADEGNGRFALLWSDLPYLLESQWDISSKYDVWVMDLEEQRLQKVGSPVAGRPQLSPAGNYTIWWDGMQQQWFAYDNREQSTRNLTGEIPVNFWNEKNDVPSSPAPYGMAAWGEEDAWLLLYDAFDIWKIDPSGEAEAVNITRGVGRRDSLTFR